VKWVTYAAALTATSFATSFLVDLLPSGQVVADFFFLVGVAGIPVAAGIAILRYRLYEIDILINRTLVYGSLTVMLVAVYAGSIVILQGFLRAPTGEESQLAIVASTLAVAALFTPLRRRLQSFMDRRFYRQEVRCEEDPRSLLRQAQGRDGSRRIEGRARGGGKGDDATGPRLFVVAPRDSSEGHASRLASLIHRSAGKVTAC
jgi:hypothetical protein